MTVTNARTGKKVRLSRPRKVFARDRESLEEAFAGDGIGCLMPSRCGDNMQPDRNEFKVPA